MLSLLWTWRVRLRVPVLLPQTHQTCLQATWKIDNSLRLHLKGRLKFQSKAITTTILVSRSSSMRISNLRGHNEHSLFVSLPD